MNENLKKEAIELAEEVIPFRRELHENPELSYEEENSAKTIVRELEKLDLDEIRTNIGGHGVVGLLKGEKPGKTVLLRADFDALPINECTELPFSSKTPGKMHACGHDMHASILLGACKYFCKNKDKINGNILFVFQPAEETPPDGGAKLMIRDGVLENPKVDAAVALHVWDEEVGKVAFRDGAMMAQSDRIFIKVNGKAAHASQPENGHDAIVAAASIINNIQTIVSRNVSPFTPLVITLGKIEGGSRYNVIPAEVKIEGTIRYYDPDLAEKMPEKLNNLIKPIAEGLGCSTEVDLVRGYGATINDSNLYKIAYSALTTQLGEENVVIPEYPATGGEDFSAFTREVPSLYIWLGIKSDKNIGKTTIHNELFSPDEDAIATGIETIATVAYEILNS